MSKLRPYAKSVIAGLGTVIYAVTAAFSDERVSNSEWVAIATAILMTLGVYQVPNTPAPVEDLSNVTSRVR